MAATLPATDSLLDLGQAPMPLSAASVFGAPLELEVELGIGNGRFLVARAAATPGSVFIGVERSVKYLRLAATRAARQGVTNVRLARTTAEDLLFRCLGESSVQVFHIYFPDPWPKKRHHKRRLVNAATVGRIADVLAPGGLLQIKTDHPGYAAVIEEVLRGESRLAAMSQEQAFADLPPTQYELRYAREGRAVHRFALRRV